MFLWPLKRGYVVTAFILLPFFCGVCLVCDSFLLLWRPVHASWSLWYVAFKTTRLCGVRVTAAVSFLCMEDAYGSKSCRRAPPHSCMHTSDCTHAHMQRLSARMGMDTRGVGPPCSRAAPLWRSFRDRHYPSHVRSHRCVCLCACVPVRLSRSRCDVWCSSRLLHLHQWTRGCCLLTSVLLHPSLS